MDTNMTLPELEQVEQILVECRDKVYSSSLIHEITLSLLIINREINLKKLNPVTGLYTERD